MTPTAVFWLSVHAECSWRIGGLVLVDHEPAPCSLQLMHVLGEAPVFGGPESSNHLADSDSEVLESAYFGVLGKAH